MSTICVHSVPGRLRLRSSAVKNNVLRAEKMQADLQACAGVSWVQANPLTGSVLVSFDPESASTEMLLQEVRNIELRKIEVVPAGRRLHVAKRQMPGTTVTQHVLRHAAEQIAERLVVLLILAIAA